MPQIVRKIEYKMVVLDFLYGTGGSQDFATARAYEVAESDKYYLGKIFHDGEQFGDIGQAQTAKLEKEAYRLIDSLFPELINKGLKAEGYVKYTLLEIEQSGLKRPPIIYKGQNRG